jgi:hypothetical protein
MATDVEANTGMIFQVKHPVVEVDGESQILSEFDR